MNEPPAELADAQHPWIGLASFTENDRQFFAGRGDEIEELVRLVRRDNLTLLYGVSGLGKTSLLQAGLFPAVREENYLPVPIRIDHLEGAPPLSAQVLGAITAAAIAAKVEAPAPRPNETLWEYFHREGNHFWGPRNDLVTPFLAFDQFEELFTLGRENPARAARVEAFISELADLVENRPSAALRGDPLRAKEFNFKPAPVKVLLSMREDYLADLDRIRSHFRALGQNRLRLLPMGERQARQVIALGSTLLAPGVEDRIVKYVAGAVTETSAAEITVAPALLSLVLRELNERRLARGPDAKITPDLLDVEQHKIFEDFYLRTLQDFPAGVRLFIEDELLTASGHRNSAALDDALTRPDVTLPILNELVNRRLLAYEDRHNTRRVELTHDVLVPVIKASRDSRLTREAQAQAERLQAEHVAQRRKQKITMAVACALAIALLATIWGGYYVFVQEHRAYYAEFAKKNGFPLGLIPLSDTEARRLSVSYLLTYKGITREGWKLKWKPAFRMVAVNSQLEPTTRHYVGTYLWDKSASNDDEGQSSDKGKRLGLQAVCQWEFVSNATGEIIYERGLDRDGRVISGFIYSPLASSSTAVRLARFVGPDGFPQFQRGSKAEYVSIHYDQNGWEDRVTYRDGKNLPAAGPDGAFGKSVDHDANGRITQMLSLDADGRNMIDDAGNCGMQLIYNEKGWLVERRSVGPDLKPMPLTEGWVMARNQSDEFGRLRRALFYGLNNEPIIVKGGYRGWETEYDAHGNPLTTTYLGLDGKPIFLSSGMAIFRSVYDQHGNVTQTTYYGVKGEPVVHRDGNHGWEAQYDEHENKTATTYIGLDAKPISLSSGYATLRATYDAYGRKTRQTYYDVKGEPALHTDGNHGWESQYDERGNEISTTFFGLDNKPVLLSEGYAVIKRKYDSDGNELEMAYFDAASKPTSGSESGVHKFVNSYDGRGKVVRKKYYDVEDKPALHKDGTHGWEAQYDDRGYQISITYFDLEEKPILTSTGFATMKSTWDARGKQTRMSLYGIHGERVLHKDGHHGWEAVFDERGRRTAVTHFGLDEKPILLPDNYAIVKWAYDTRDMVVRQTYYGANADPILYHKEYYGWTSEYDERGNEIGRTYLGLDGKPITLAAGYAQMRAVYDPRGKITRMTFHGVKGEPVLHKDGNHGWESKYDERGNETETTFLGLNGEPALLPSGYAIVRLTYDARGNTIRTTYHGVDGKPILRKEGYQGWKAKYNERGKQIEKVFFDLDGNPVTLMKP
ncbi:MAG: hypothetical protein DLM73_11085 [Chthoniobacterales bacterium]|nr:MAG: hypothetical protein DLM73_11085 [Chthoniobacterales bacterium]